MKAERQTLYLMVRRSQLFAAGARDEDESERRHSAIRCRLDSTDVYYSNRVFLAKKREKQI